MGVWRGREGRFGLFKIETSLNAGQLVRSPRKIISERNET